MPKQIKFNEDARAAMKKGIDKLSEAVKMTLGPRGRAVVIEKSYGAPQVTFDGVTVAKEIELQDKYENLGADFIKQAADKTNDNVGDGTTTAVVLAHAMMTEGEKAVQETGFNVIQLAEELRKGSAEVVRLLDDQKELINDNKKIEEVATLSAKDSEIGRKISEVMSKIGKDGVITVDDSNTIGISYEMVEGMSFDKGYVSGYMITNQEKMEASLENPYILVTDKKISAINEILPLLEKLIQSGKKELVIIADDLEGEALATLVVNKLRGIFTVLAVKAPGFGDRKKEMLEDIAIMTGAELISDELGRKLDAVDITSLGQAHRVIATKDNTTIVDGKGSKGEIEKRISQIKSQIGKTDSDFDKEKFNERLGKLSGGVAVLKVGAPTETMQKELKQRVEDAVAATRAAMAEGIVPGGGIALFNLTMAPENQTEDKRSIARAARMIINNALRAPIKAILANSGKSVDDFMEDIVQKKITLGIGKKESVWVGFNAVTNKIENLKESGIIDPVKVTKTAFMNAVSVASNYLMTGVAITDLPEKKDGPGMPGGMGGMPGMGEY